ncbi:MAG: glycosyltransferase family 4 protein [Candidatus Fimenecus sp.]
MNVLWIVNMVFPAVAKQLGIHTSASGGWLLDLAKGVSEQENVQLTVMTYYDGPFRDLEIDGIRHLLFPGGGKRLLYDNPKTQADCKKAVALCAPDLIHIHGTEYAPGLAMLKACPEIPSLLTIQGVLRRISEEYYGGIPFRTILAMTSPIDWLKLKTPFTYKQLYKYHVKREEDVLRHVRYVTGRTDWDKATMLDVNPSLTYFRCNYNLRDAFYDSEKWSVDTMNRHTIMTGAALYSLKGLHILLRALSLVRQKYPEVHLFVPGGTAENGRIVHPTCYIRYIEKLIQELDLEENVTFTGTLSPEQVAQYLRTANVCVVPSAMEGASATLCEAMMIGTPSICAFRGGMTDLITDKENGFTYDFPEYPLLALRIMEIFENDTLAADFSARSIERANVRHDRARNPREMIAVYKEVLNGSRS